MNSSSTIRPVLLLLIAACGVSESVPPAERVSASGGAVAVVPGRGGSDGRGGRGVIEGSGGRESMEGSGGRGGSGVGGAVEPGRGGAGGAVARGPDAGAQAGGSAGNAATPDAATPTMTGEGVMIGASIVPKNKVLVFLHIGHSNMAGRAKGPAAERPYFYDVHPQLWSFHWPLMTRAMGIPAWRPAKEPLSPDSMTGSMAGPGMGLLRAAQAMAPSDAFLVSIGHGHSGMEGGNCKGYRRGGLLYDFVMGPAMRLKGKVTFAGVFTMLGITERHLDLASQGGFSDCMKGIADEMRADLGEPELPFIVGGYEVESTGELEVTGEFARRIMPQIEMVPRKVTRAAVIDTSGIKVFDSHHFDMASHKEWGLRAIKVLKGSGWAPWAK